MIWKKIVNKVIILPLSLYMKNEQQRTVAAFEKLGISKLLMRWHFIPLPKWLERFRGPSLPTLFDQYRRGELSTVLFRNKIREKFPKANFSNHEFDAAWNAMQAVSPSTKDALKEANELQALGYTVYLLAGTNPLHIQDIKQKSGLKTLPGIPYYSHQKKRLGRDLFSQLLKDIRARHAGIRNDEIAFFYKEPKDPKAWFYDLIKKYEYKQASAYVSKLKEEAASVNGFSLVQCLENSDNKAHVKTSLKQLGWVVDKSLLSKQNPAVTNAFVKTKRFSAVKQKEEPHPMQTRSRAMKKI